MSPDNLTAVYNQNPTIQSMYTLPEYLSLFGQGSYTPIQPTPTDPTPTDPTPEPGIPNIINQNFNQGGGEGDGNNTIGGKDYGYNSSFAQDDKVQGPQTKEEIEGFLNDIGEGTIDDDDLTAGLSFKEGLYSLQNTFKNLPTPLNLARKGIKAFNDYQEKKAKEKEIELQKEIDAANLAAAQQAAFDKAMADQKSFYASLRDGRGATSTKEGRDNAGGGAAANRGEAGSGWDSSPFARGGRVRRSYFNGGIVSLRRR